MKKASRILLPVIFASAFFIVSCRKECRTCRCEREGEVFIEKNCAIGNAQCKNLDSWEEYLRNDRDFDSVTCVDD